MNLVRYHGVELPVFEDEPVAWSPDEIETAAAESSTFVRRISVHDTRHLRLDRLLTLADNLIEEVCAQTDAIPVPHQWGLHPVEPGPLTMPCRYLEACYHEGDVPAGYHLVAEVESVTPSDADKLLTDPRSLIGACTSYLEKPLAKGTPYIYDVGIHQFVEGQASSTQPGLHYVDFEPRIYYHGTFR